MKSKALFMLFIFLLNTVVGFSCALHMSHADHDENGEHHNEHHHHGSSLCHQHENNSVASVSYIGKDDPCCQGAVNNFVSLAKLMPQTGKVAIQSPIAYIVSFYRFSLVTTPGVITRHQISIDALQRPPTPDIRIAIQSFQI